jgi:serine/threonine-protein kinase
MIGSKLGPYQLVEEVGRGGMATVYRAYQPNVDRYVAVKVIHRSIAVDTKSLDRFTREAKLVARLEHPHILPVYDYDGLNDPPYIVMRYLPTGTLKDILERTQLPFNEVVLLLSQIAAALDYAHRQGVIHRDIKPTNIMVDSEGNAFLTDFGIARMAESSSGLTGTGMAIGTPGYMAPEQGLGVPIDGRADIYSLGVMAYEMLTGMLPYSAETPMAVILKHINDPVPDIVLANPTLPVALRAVIQRAMAKNPEDRFATASDFARALSVAIGPSEDMTPHRLRAAASQTISDLAQAREERRKQIEEMTAGRAAIADSPAPPTVGNQGTPPRGIGGTPATRQLSGAVPLPTTAGGRGNLAILAGAGVIIVLILLIGGYFVISSTNNANATGTAVANTVVAIAQSQNESATAQQGILVAANATASAVKTATPSPTNTNTGSGLTASFVPPTATIPVVLPTKAATVTPSPTSTTTPSQTFTKVPTATTTPSQTFTNTPTFTVTPSQTFTSTPTVTPSPTASPTVTIAPTQTLPPTATPTLAPPTATLTPTQVPVGKLPYLNDFESADALQDWDYDPSVWKILPDSGKSVLIGTGTLKQPLIVLGKKAPEWQTTTDLLVSMRVNLDQAESISRIIVRYSDKGYYVLEMLAGGLLTVSRGAAGKPPDRSSERQLQKITMGIRNGTWYTVQMWTDATRVYVYIDNQLVIQAEDTGDPLPGGKVLLQTVSANYRVKFDNLKIQRPLIASQHFQGSDWPTTWNRDSATSAKIDTDNRGNGFIHVFSGTVSPLNPPTPDMFMSCRILSVTGGLEFRIRDGAQGAYQFQFIAGNMTINQLDGTGKVVKKWDPHIPYAHGNFFELNVETLGDELRIFKNGDVVFDEHIPNFPQTGQIVFRSTKSDDEFELDDCLFVDAAKSVTEDATWAFDKIRDVEARPAQQLLTEWYDYFDEKFRTKDWWEGGLNAPGDTKADRNDKDHLYYLEIPYKDGANYRIFRNVKDFYVFGAGQNKVTFYDSSDIYLRVNVRVQKKGTVWIMARTSTSLGGGNLNGFRLALTQDENGVLTLTADGYSIDGLQTYYQGPLPPATTPQSNGWVQLLIVTYQDKVAYFANQHFVTSLSGVKVLDGTVAIGVDKDTIGDFNDFELRDVSPETR